jgi:hypothetical protein
MDLINTVRSDSLSEIFQRVFSVARQSQLPDPAAARVSACRE